MKNYKIYSGRIVIWFDDEFYEVELYRDDKKLKKNTGYISGEYVYIFRGKLKDSRGVLKSGIYLDLNGNHIFHSDKDIELYNIDNIVELNPGKIFEAISKNRDSFLSEDDIETININSETFTTIIKPNDDFLKQAIKQAINDKKINLKLYKDKFKNEHSLNNMKSALNKSSKMTVSYFKDWCEILGLKCDIIIEDNGKDKISPLTEKIFVYLE